MTTVHRAPTACPVCDANLVTTRLGCHSCGTELVGAFGSCDFCALDAKDVDLLKVFLVSRGNMREVEKHLGVSYPTARLRFAQVLSKLGLNGDGDVAPVPLTADQVLAGVADGSLDPDEAARLLAALG
ncbi:MAG: DUF2089 domain-containing protein [Propionibacteriaceae bacterium]|nr:DUF2089 domain-containing protein [Micropruina sp.]